ncbi:DUF294 nucleotidyltransferase-like domain-containing protein [Sinorhizobium alkalisoli]|uniref:Histidine kinase n=1 Tax=Sinorhizobium alkalisoli TaxID=1752398 RepID=A0A1E3V9G0_9HYPH|nr:DUF294 nucleotidyltransferase-like domain-containing protein [Sinorhizobium alkalisoli]ODR90274.1 histidine kinase [Sinorhizobium alkalisoli]
MDDTNPDIARFLETAHPYDSLPREELEHVVRQFRRLLFPAGSGIYKRGDPLPGLFLVMQGAVEVRDASGTVVSQLFPRNSLGERGLLVDGRAVTSASALQDAILLMLPATEFKRLMAEYPVYSRFFTRGREAASRRADITMRKVKDLMSSPPRFCAPSDSVRAAAEMMRKLKISGLAVVEHGKLTGIVTTRDLTARVLAEGLDPAATPVSAVMTASPLSLEQEALGSDVLNLMLERGIGHLPVVAGERLVGMITQTDITRFQALSSALLIADISAAETVADLRANTAHVPQLLLQLAGANAPHEVVTRLITDVTDAVTRRLIALAERELGPPPVPYVWLACGSQGRQEQTGISDQDNCIFIDDAFEEAAHRPWFTKLAHFVSHNLDACGYVFCPGDMMATNQRWCQPVRTWREYFYHWIHVPEPMAQMLASVMFDLRPIAGEATLYRDVQTETLEDASRNSIFVAHMVSNSLKHAPPLGLLRGFATIRGGEHRNQIDMKHNGVVPVVDLGRVYALLARLRPVNTRSRLLGAEERGVISGAGARDLIAAYDLIADIRIRNQAMQIKAGQRPTNHLAPYDLGEFERSHLRDAFVVVRTMQSALANSGMAPI